MRCGWLLALAAEASVWPLAHAGPEAAWATALRDAAVPGACDGAASLSLLQQAAGPSGSTLQTSGHAPRRGRGAAPARGGDYFWPSGRGRPGLYSASPHAAPKNLSRALAWSWHHPAGRFHTLTFGTAIDGESNVYLTAADAIRKFSADGELLWTSEPVKRPAEIPNAASLLDGALYSSATNGEVFAIDMETGRVLWLTKVSDKIDGTNGFVSAHAGVVVVGSNVTSLSESNSVVSGLNASDGALLWRFKPDAPVWNFMASFPGDGSFTFQDREGRAYRCRLNNGGLVWKAGGVADSWTDGSSLLGPNAIVYAVNTFAGMGIGGPDTPGMLSAYAVADGKLLWNRTMPRPPNNMPGIGKLVGGGGLSVVQPIGQQVLKGAPTDIYAMDAETGELQWVFKGPAQKGFLQAGDFEGMPGRISAGLRATCLPNPWSAPTVDGDGVVYVGNEEGNLYALRDVDGDGLVAGAGEVDSLDTGAAFAGSAGPSHAPGMLAVASCDTLFVFRGA